MFKKSLFGLAVSIVLFACQDELTNEVKPQDQTVGEVIDINNLLSFESKDDYLKVFEDESYLEGKSLNFTSLKSKIADFAIEKASSVGASKILTNPVDTIYDDYGVLPEILNKDKIVKIGEYLIKVDLHNERVLSFGRAT